MGHTTTFGELRTLGANEVAAAKTFKWFLTEGGDSGASVSVGLSGEDAAAVGVSEDTPVADVTTAFQDGSKGLMKLPDYFADILLPETFYLYFREIDSNGSVQPRAIDFIDAVNVAAKNGDYSALPLAIAQKIKGPDFVQGRAAVVPPTSADGTDYLGLGEGVALAAGTPVGTNLGESLTALVPMLSAGAKKYVPGTGAIIAGLTLNKKSLKKTIRTAQAGVTTGVVSPEAVRKGAGTFGSDESGDLSSAADAKSKFTLYASWLDLIGESAAGSSASGGVGR